MPRWRVLLISAGGTAVEGRFDYRGADLPHLGDIIDVRDRSVRDAAMITARVQLIDQRNVLPITAAVELGS